MIMHRYCDSKMNKITMRTVIRERKFKRVTRINNDLSGVKTNAK